MEGDLFQRYPKNPILTARDIPYQVNTVFNAGVVDLGKEVVLLLRVESTSGRSHITLARSKDGITNWKVESHAFMHPGDGHPYEEYGIEDCRVTQVEGIDGWLIAYTAYSAHGPAIGLAQTTDFKSVQRLGIIFPPNNKDAALFPKKIDGLYAILHRPSAAGGSIWVGYSEDLSFWGKYEVVLPPRGGPWWDGVRVGAGLPPIETSEGWLMIYHGVKQTPGGPIYRVGAALLDYHKPHQLIAKTRRWLLSPQEPYERIGDVPNVIFPCGGFIRDNQLWIYYGASDSCICLATVDLQELLTTIKTT
ncbi:MAG: glycosidase [Calditrichaeota bacterium]|nr:MAG: glycosidase [Calditrichota bacterium]